MSALPAHVSSADMLEVPTYVGSSAIGFFVVGSSKLIGVSLLASIISDVSGMIPDVSGMANGLLTASFQNCLYIPLSPLLLGLLILLVWRHIAELC